MITKSDQSNQIAEQTAQYLSAGGKIRKLPYWVDVPDKIPYPNRACRQAQERSVKTNKGRVHKPVTTDDLITSPRRTTI